MRKYRRRPRLTESEKVMMCNRWQQIAGLHYHNLTLLTKIPRHGAFRLGAEIGLKELYKRVELSPQHSNLDRFHIGLAEKLD